MANIYNVFISWSKPRSKHVALALREWLPMVVQAAKPWMSDVDIEPGSRSLLEIVEKLSGARLGISCVTPENMLEPWLQFEAGALTKTIDDKTRLYTYLLGDLDPGDVKPPLGMFQALRAQPEPTRKLVHSLNRALNDPALPESPLDKLFDLAWPLLRDKLNSMPVLESDVVAKRQPAEMIAEILEITRAEANKRQKVDTLDPFISLFDELLPIVPQLREILRNIKLQTLSSVNTAVMQDAVKND
ncbi:MAG TPA: hypothetical protein VGG72_35155 [Bryobacteraceae bacterium]|jgi:hypothetical protein